MEIVERSVVADAWLGNVQWADGLKKLETLALYKAGDREVHSSSCP